MSDLPRPPRNVKITRDEHGHAKSRDIELRMKDAFLALRIRKQGYDQTDLANDVSHRVGRARPYDRSAVVRWMQGTKPDNLNVMAAIADALGVNITWLWWGRGYRHPRKEDLEIIEPVVVRGFDIGLPQGRPPANETASRRRRRKR